LGSSRGTLDEAQASTFTRSAFCKALEDAGWRPENDQQRLDTGVAIGQGFSGLDDIKEACELLEAGKYRRISPYFIPRILTNTAGGYVALTHGLWGPNHSVATACATGSNAVGDAYRFILHGDAEVMLAGGTEASLRPVAIAGFCRLNALSTGFNGEQAPTASRPFDIARDGFVMGEGAGVLVLEELQHAKRRGARIYAEVVGYGLGGDGHHMTAPAADGRGAVRAMRHAMKDATLLPTDLSYINAHATSTPLGDEIELRAIGSLVKEPVDQPWISSTKGAVGHLLGAAGAVEAMFCVAAIHTQVIPPSINLDDPINVPGSVRIAANSAVEAQVTSAMSNSFGFGGTCTSLIFANFSSSLL